VGCHQRSTCFQVSTLPESIQYAVLRHFIHRKYCEYRLGGLVQYNSNDKRDMSSSVQTATQLFYNVSLVIVAFHLEGLVKALLCFVRAFKSYCSTIVKSAISLKGFYSPCKGCDKSKRGFYSCRGGELNFTDRRSFKAETIQDYMNPWKKTCSSRRSNRTGNRLFAHPQRSRHTRVRSINLI
jgi:hypothetical protein